MEQNKNYEPSKKEVLTQLLKDANHSTLKNVGEFVGGFSIGYPIGFFLMYALPTTLRVGEDLDRKNPRSYGQISDGEGLGGLIGLISGAWTTLYTSSLLYDWLSGSDNFSDKFFGMFVPILATQTASASYEIGRKIYQVMQKRYIKKKNELIENQIMAEPNNKLEIAPPQEISPEDEKARGLIVKSALKLEELAKELKQS